MDTHAILETYYDFLRNPGATTRELGRRAMERQLEFRKTKRNPNREAKREAESRGGAASGGGGGSAKNTKGGRRVSKKQSRKSRKTSKTRKKNFRIIRRYSKRR